MEGIILDDLNLIIRSVKDISRIIQEEQQRQKKNFAISLGDASKYQAEIDRLTRKKERAYEDYSDHIITREEYVRYRDKYDEQITAAQSKIDAINQMKDHMPVKSPWVQKLLQYEELYHLDREIVVEMISMIYIYEDNTIKIVYNFSNELETLLDRRTCED